MTELIVSLARLDNGRFVAASTTSPFFCFEADTEEAATQKVDQALAFYQQAKREVRAQDRKERPITLRRIRPYSRKRHELAVA